MNVLDYIESFISTDHPQLTKIALELPLRQDIEPTVGLHVGRLLYLLVRLMNAQNALEFGPCLGYSTIWLAEALRETGGKLISIERDADALSIAKENVEAAGLSSIVEFILGDAGGVINEINDSFDLILQDSDKTLYPGMLERCINLTRKGGLILADDALFKPMGIREDYSKPVDEYNRRIFADDRLCSTILPIGDGLTLSVKLFE